MRKLVTNTFVTLDGVMQAPGGPEEDPTGGFAYGGWSVSYWDDRMAGVIQERLARPFDLLLGRKTYEIFAAHWPFVKDDPTADALNAARKYVASRTLQRVDWHNSTVIRDLPRSVADLKAEDGPEIQVHGSPGLIQSLLRNDLIDELRLWTFPLVLGSGKRLFGDGTLPRNLQLADQWISSTGVAVTTYQVAGPIRPGTLDDSPILERFALEAPTESELARRQRLER